VQIEVDKVTTQVGLIIQFGRFRHCFARLFGGVDCLAGCFPRHTQLCIAGMESQGKIRRLFDCRVVLNVPVIPVVQFSPIIQLLQFSHIMPVHRFGRVSRRFTDATNEIFATPFRVSPIVPNMRTGMAVRVVPVIRSVPRNRFWRFWWWLRLCRKQRL